MGVQRRGSPWFGPDLTPMRTGSLVGRAAEGGRRASLGRQIHGREDQPAQVPKKIIIAIHSKIPLLGIYPKKEKL